jgi:hypothetical protein
MIRTRTDRISLASLLVPALEHWRVMMAVPAIAAVLTTAFVVLSPREWYGQMALSTIVNPRNLPLSGGLSTLLNAGSIGGLQATPALIARLAEQYGVLHAVAYSPMSNADSETVLQRLMKTEGDIPQKDVVKKMSNLVKSSFDKQTGVITLEIAAEDSTLVRVLATRLVEQVSATFIRSSKAQAREVRLAMQARVDSAERELRRHEEALRAFLDQNRVVVPHSLAYVSQQRLQRALDISQSTYAQAISDRNEALGKELEETPAVVVVDPLPQDLLPVARRTILKAIAAAILVAIPTWLLLIARSGLSGPGYSGADPSRERFMSALTRIPIIGSASRWALGLPRNPRQPTAPYLQHGDGRSRAPNAEVPD